MRFFLPILKGLAFLVFAFPRVVYLAVGDFLGATVFYVFRFRRDLVLKHLEMAFPARNLKERQALAKKSYQHQGRTLLEYALIPFLNRDNIGQRVATEGDEHLRSALKEGKGVLLLTAHMGNGDLALVALALLGYPVQSISKRFRSEWLNRLWFGLRESKGIRYIPEEKSSFQILRALRDNQVVAFVLDQFMGPPAGVRTKFFGHETGTAVGLALFAQRTRAPVVPAFTYRRPNGQHVIRFEAPLDTSSFTKDDAGLTQATQLFNDQIERWVCLHPEQWMWLHRRWKTFEVR